MDDIYSLMMADEPTAQERAQAMAAALRRQHAAGNLGILTGDKVLSRFGAAQLEGAAQGEGMLAQAGGQRSGQRLQRALTAEAARRAEANAQRARTWETQDAATQRAFQAEQSALGRASQERAAALAAGQRAEKLERGPNIPASEVANYGGIDAATAMLDDLMATREQKTGALSGLAQYLPGTEAGEYADTQRAAAQTVGLILEGGKLAEGDLSRYMAMIPSAGDSADRAKAKVETIKRMLATKKAAQFSALKDAGYNTGKLTPDVAPVKVRGASSGGSVDLAAPEPSAAAPAERQVVKKQVNRTTKQTRLVYADGTTEVVDGIQ